MENDNKKEIIYEYSSNGFTIPEFAYKHLGLNAIEAYLFGMMFSYGYINATLENLCVQTGIRSQHTVYDKLQGMVDRDIIKKVVYKINGNISRTVYTNCYDRGGRIPDNTIDDKLNRGLENLRKYYNMVNPIRMRTIRLRKKEK